MLYKVCTAFILPLVAEVLAALAHQVLETPLLSSTTATSTLVEVAAPTVVTQTNTVQLLQTALFGSIQHITVSSL